MDLKKVDAPAEPGYPTLKGYYANRRTFLAGLAAAGVPLTLAGRAARALGSPPPDEACPPGEGEKPAKMPDGPKKPPPRPRGVIKRPDDPPPLPPGKPMPPKEPDKPEEPEKPKDPEKPTRLRGKIAVPRKPEKPKTPPAK